jgi:hypothetical protein
MQMRKYHLQELKMTYPATYQMLDDNHHQKGASSHGKE